MTTEDKGEKVKEFDNFTINLVESQHRIFEERESKFGVSDDTWIPDKAKQNYHEQRLGQSKWAFRLSFWGAIFGFFIIIVSFVYGLRTGNIETIGLISGCVVEVVSALFYTLSNRANEKITEFFRELTIDSNIERSLGLAEKVKEDFIRDGLLVKLSLHLSGIDEERICKYTNDICNIQKDDDK